MERSAYRAQVIMGGQSERSHTSKSTVSDVGKLSVESVSAPTGVMITENSDHINAPKTGARPLQSLNQIQPPDGMPSGPIATTLAVDLSAAKKALTEAVASGISEEFIHKGLVNQRAQWYGDDLCAVDRECPPVYKDDFFDAHLSSKALCERFDLLVETFCDQLSGVAAYLDLDSALTAMRPGGKLNKYIKDNVAASEDDSSKIERLILLLRELSSFCRVLGQICQIEQENEREVTPESPFGRRLENALSQFPPHHIADYRCVDGMRQRLENAMRIFQNLDDIDGDNVHQQIISVVDRTLTGFIEKKLDQFWRSTSRGNQIHLPSMLTSYLVGSPYALSKDKYAHLTRVDVSAAKIYELQSEFVATLNHALEGESKKLLQYGLDFIAKIEQCDFETEEAGKALQAIRNDPFAKLMEKHLPSFDPSGPPLVELDDDYNPRWSRDGCERSVADLLEALFVGGGRGVVSAVDGAVESGAEVARFRPCYQDFLNDGALSDIAESIRNSIDDPSASDFRQSIRRLHLMLTAGGGSKISGLLALVKLGNPEGREHITARKALGSGVELLKASRSKLRQQEAFAERIDEVIRIGGWIQDRSKNVNDKKSRNHRYNYYYTLSYLSNGHWRSMFRNPLLTGVGSIFPTIAYRRLLKELVKGDAPVSLWQHCLEDKALVRSCRDDFCSLTTEVVHLDLPAISDLLEEKVRWSKDNGFQFREQFLKVQLSAMINKRDYAGIKAMASRLVHMPLLYRVIRAENAPDRFKDYFETAIGLNDPGLIDCFSEVVAADPTIFDGKLDYYKIGRECAKYGRADVLSALFDIGLKQKLMPSRVRAFELCTFALNGDHSSVIELLASHIGGDIFNLTKKVHQVALYVGESVPIEVNLLPLAILGGENAAGGAPKAVRALHALDTSGRRLIEPCVKDRTPLLLASHSNRIRSTLAIIDILTKEEILASRDDNNRSIGFYLPAHNRHYEMIIDALLEKGITIDQLCQPDPESPNLIGHLVSKRQYPLLGYLFEKGVAPEQSEKVGDTEGALGAMYVAAKRGDLKALRVMMKGGPAGKMTLAQAEKLLSYALDHSREPSVSTCLIDYTL